jgi:hypothetical protein
MNSYEQKREERIARMRARAARLAGESAGAYEGAKRIADGIPFGQPILVGHHSERRARRDAERIHNGFGKAFELARESKDLDRRADAAERSTAVSSDDPDAVAKLREKLEEEKAAHELVLAANKKLRAGASLDEVAAGLPWDEARRRLEIILSLGNRTIPVANGTANIRRLEKRIAELEAKASRGPREPERYGDIVVDELDNRVRVEFPGKPDEACRNALKGSGFRWSPSAGRWVRMASEGAWYWARKIAEVENAKAVATPCQP